MKKILIAVVVIFTTMSLSFSANAQNFDGVRFGVMGGLTSSSTKIKDVKTKSISLYHLGLVAEFNVGGGFVIQPALTYQVKGERLDKTGEKTVNDVLKSFDTKVGFVELPVQIQWGPDLMLFRPYVFAEPFVGYQLTRNTKFEAKNGADDNNKEAVKQEIKKGISVLKEESKKLEYGLALGAGIELGRFQLSAKYFWNFGKMFDKKQDPADKAYSKIKEAFKQGNNFNGISFSVAIFF